MLAETQEHHEGAHAPGGPGAKPTWSSGAKTGVGSSATGRSRVWYTLSHGAIDEVYFPDVDTANTRSVRFLIADGEGFFSDEREDTDHKVEMFEPGVPGYRVTSTDKSGRYRLHKEILSDPDRNTLLMRVRFEPLRQGSKLQLYLFIEPQIENKGYENDAWVDDYLNVPALFAQRNAIALAAVGNRPFLQRTCGYTGASDALTDLRKHFRLSRLFTEAPHGNVALCAQIDLAATGGEFLIAVGFGATPEEAALLARASVSRPFEKALGAFIQQWRALQAEHRVFRSSSPQEELVYRASTAMLSVHELQMFPGGMIASLSIPWGFAKTDDELSGYHVLWPRDMVQTGLGKLASGDPAGARRTLFYLACTQRAEGSWSQNMWKTGKAHWDAIQMDTIAMPVLLADKLRQENELDGYDAWPMVRSAAEYLIRFGPESEQERWENFRGFSISSMAVQIAAVLAAADFADEAGRHEDAAFLRETADAWNMLIDEFLYVAGTELAQQHGVPGYYMRIAPSQVLELGPRKELTLRFPDVPENQEQPAVNVVSPDALMLVRYGLRRADDPKILHTLQVIDATLLCEMTTGKGWIRSSFDGYGEREDGSPYDETGIGRCWPLLAGERGHYAVAAGDDAFAREMLATMARQTSECGMIPEQVWNGPDLPERELFNGHANGSSMPLAWAHAEFIRLLRSIQEGRVWDMPPQTVKRYLQDETTSPLRIWSPFMRRKWIITGQRLRIDLDEPCEVRCRVPNQPWQTYTTEPPRMQRHCVYVPTEAAPANTAIDLDIHKRGGETIAAQIKVLAEAPPLGS